MRKMSELDVKLRAAENLDPSGISQRRRLTQAGRYERLAPFLIDTHDADSQTAQMVQTYFSTKVQNYPSIEILSMLEAVVCGQGAVISRYGELLRESVAEFVAHGRVPDGLGIRNGAYLLRSEIQRRIDKPCLLAKRPWYRNFGHWLVDAAPILALAGDVCREDGLAVVIGQCESSGMRRVMLETIERVLPNVDVLIQPDSEAWGFSDLRYVMPVHVPPLFKLPSGLSRLRDAMLPGNTPEPKRRLFISRGASGGEARGLLNEDEILGMFVRQGYELTFPEQLPIHEQAALFASAKEVIGVKGAALTNAIFCAPGATVMVLSPSDFPDPFFWDICGQRGIHYGEVFGPVSKRGTQGTNSFTINKERVRSMLRAAEMLR